MSARPELFDRSSTDLINSESRFDIKRIGCAAMPSLVELDCRHDESYRGQGKAEGIELYRDGHFAKTSSMSYRGSSLRLPNGQMVDEVTVHSYLRGDLCRSLSYKLVDTIHLSRSCCCG